MVSRVAGCFLVLGFGALMVGACNGTIGSELDESLIEDSGSGGAGAANGGPGGNFNPTGGDGTGGGDSSCADLVLEPQTVPVSMFITVDKSGSMGSNNKWNNTRQAFNAFFQTNECTVVHDVNNGTFNLATYRVTLFNFLPWTLNFLLQAK